MNPFYNGDHRAHAQRIFDTHMDGGVDRVGHFSAGQYMFIAETGGQPVGLIHVVEKKQETVKVSPLIVSPDYRGKLGIGSLLLEYAEAFARNLGARQLYCTVVRQTRRRWGSFFGKGFASPVRRKITTRRVSTSICCTSNWVMSPDSSHPMCQ